MQRRGILRTFGLLVLALVACAKPRVISVPKSVVVAPTPVPIERTVESVLAEIGPEVRARLAPSFIVAGVAYPPRALALLAFKEERRLEVWAWRDVGWVRIDVYPILAASGVAGPKLRRGDGQVPEGIYRVVALNPNSWFHLSMMLDYPNADDLAEAERAGRDDLGGDIFIHGGARSIGCLAMGDRIAENLFVLVADAGIEQVEVVIAPHDPRGGSPLRPIASVDFTRDLYARVTERLRAFRVPPATGG